MSKYLKLQIPNGCHEDWHTMLPEEQGRFCQSCRKKVVDFTHMSDRELVQFFQQEKGSTCGRFTKEQLNRDLHMPNKPLPWIKYFIQATLPAFLLSMKASALITRVHYPTHLSALQKAVSDTSNLPATITVEGQIQDEQGNSIPHATIMLKGTNRGVLADSAGRFVFPNLQAPATLVISSVGYQLQEVPVHAGQSRLLLKMQLSAMLLGEVVTVGYVSVSRPKKKDKKAKVATVEKEKGAVLLYPNPLPAGKSLSIQCNKLEYGSYSLQLFNIAGVQVHSEKVAFTKGMYLLQVQVPQVAAGNYFMKLTHEKKGISFTEQVVITL